MNNLHAPFDVFRKIGLLALMGFGVIMLSGPILAVLSIALSFGMVLLGFALVGFLVWLPVRLLTAGGPATVAGIHEFGRGLGHALGTVARTGARIVSFPLRVAAAMLSGAFRLAGGLVRLTWNSTWFAVEMALITATGAVVGGLVGFLTGPGHEGEMTLPMYAATGAALALVVGVVMKVRERRPRTVQLVG